MNDAQPMSVLEQILDDLAARDLADALAQKCESCGWTLYPTEIAYRRKLCGACEHAHLLDQAEDAEVRAHQRRRLRQEPP